MCNYKANGTYEHLRHITYIFGALLKGLRLIKESYYETIMQQNLTNLSEIFVACIEFNFSVIKFNVSAEPFYTYA